MRTVPDRLFGRVRTVGPGCRTVKIHTHTSRYVTGSSVRTRLVVSNLSLIIYNYLNQNCVDDYRSCRHTWTRRRSGSPAFPQTGHSASGVGGISSHSRSAARRCARTVGDSLRVSACTSCIRRRSRAVMGPPPRTGYESVLSDDWFVVCPSSLPARHTSPCAPHTSWGEKTNSGPLRTVFGSTEQLLVPVEAVGGWIISRFRPGCASVRPR